MIDTIFAKFVVEMFFLFFFYTNFPPPTYIYINIFMYKIKMINKKPPKYYLVIIMVKQTETFMTKIGSYWDIRLQV